MLYHWFLEFSDTFSYFNIFKYITFRSFLSFFTSFILCWLLGPYFIKSLVRKQVQQKIKKDGPKEHHKKQGTPTMGGAMILLVLLVTSFFWVDVQNRLVWGTLVIMFGFGLIGYIDDVLTITRSDDRGLPGLLRLAMEFTLSLLVLFFLMKKGDWNTVLYIPFFKDVFWDLGWFHLFFASFIVVGCANAVNLTDGLDGLAIGPVIVCSATLLIFSYISGHFNISDYLSIPFVKGTGELAPLSAAVMAAGLGFLWFNTYPAQVFMGDVGSLSLGGFLGMVSVLTKNEILLAVFGGIFLVEALSVISQVLSFKFTGKRIFRMAPLHHHYELKGLSESKIIVRFWIIAILLSVLSLATLKMR